MGDIASRVKKAHYNIQRNAGEHGDVIGEGSSADARPPLT